MVRGPLVLVVAVAMMTLGVASADAVTYCVTNPSCPSGGVAEPDLQTALALADGSTAVADTILLGAGTYSSTAATPFVYGNGGTATNDITVQGAGPGQTMLTQTDPNSDVVHFSAVTPTADQDIRDLTVSLVDGFGASSSKIGILGATQAENVRVVAQGAVANNSAGLAVSGNGPFTGLNIQMPVVAPFNYGVVAFRPGIAVTISDSRIAGHTGISVQPQDRLDIARARIHAYGRAIDGGFPDDGTHENVIEDTQIVVDAAGDYAVVAAPQSPQTVDATLALRHVTMRGPGGDTAFGIESLATNGNASAVKVRNSVLTGFGHPFVANGSGGTVTASNDVLPSGSDSTISGGTVTRGQAVVVADDPLLVDAGNGDLFPRFDSPAVELGNLNFTDNPIDLASHSRVVDGDGDHTATPDAGAFEYQRRPPTVTASVTSPSSSGAAAVFGAVGSDADPGDTLTYGWLFSDGATSTDQNPSHVFAAGPFSGTVIARDPTGLTAGAAATGTEPAPPPVVTPPDTTAPVISGAAFSPKTFRPSADTDTATTAAKPKKHPVGSNLKLTLSEGGTLTIVIAQKRTVHKKTTYTTKATLTRKHLVSGRQTIQFTGRFQGKALKPGSYRATITAKDAAGNRSKAVTATFTIVKK